MGWVGYIITLRRSNFYTDYLDNLNIGRQHAYYEKISKWTAIWERVFYAILNFGQRLLKKNRKRFQ